MSWVKGSSAHGGSLVLHSYNIWTLTFTTQQGASRRQVKNVTKIVKMFPNYWISTLYLESAWEMHSNKYQHAFYWFSKSWDILWKMIIVTNCDNKTSILHDETNGRVLSIITCHTAGESRRQVKNFTKYVNDVNILTFRYRIWLRHEKCNQMSTNMPSIVLV